MNIIDRYVYAVTRNLPQKQRADVERELRNLIKSKINEYGDIEGDEQRAEKVLQELGDPVILAEKYCKSKKFIIGPQNYYNYILVLKIVMGAVLLGISVAYVINLIFRADGVNLARIIGKYAASVISGVVQGFLWVTIIFLILDNKGMRTGKKNFKGGTWSIADLPPIPERKAIIPKGECIFSIIFSTIFIMVLYLTPQYIAIYIKNNDTGYNVTPLFNVEVLNGYWVLLFGMFLTSLIKEVLKIIAGRWNFRLGLAAAVLDIIGLFIMLTIFLNPAVFNNNFPSAFLKLVNVEFDAASAWNIFIKWFIVCFTAGYVIDILSVLYKGVKYNNN